MTSGAALTRRHCVAGMAATLCACGVDAKVGQDDRQARADLYQCEGCEGVFEASHGALPARARIGPADEPGEPLEIVGAVFQADGRTPEAGVVLYAYQTNAEGLYANGSSASEWSRRHGRLRGWVKTGTDGRYAFDTIKPAPYPRQTMPAHIHLTVLEPGKRPYWIDDVVFAGEFGVTPGYRATMTNQGGNGIARLERNAAGVLSVRRDIVLERHPTAAEIAR